MFSNAMKKFTNLFRSKPKPTRSSYLRATKSINKNNKSLKNNSNWYMDGTKTPRQGMHVSVDDRLFKTSKEWIPVEGFPSYEISNKDGIRNAKTGVKIKGRNWIGYPKVTLMRDGKKHEKRIHKLVAEHFVPNPKNLSIVNHDDSNRSNYVASNLSWMSQSDNMKHRWKTEKDGVKKEKYGHEHGKDKMVTEFIHKIKGQKLEKKALEKFAKANHRGMNSLFARINRAKKTGIKFPKKSAAEWIKMKKKLAIMSRRSKKK